MVMMWSDDMTYAIGIIEISEIRNCMLQLLQLKCTPNSFACLVYRYMAIHLSYLILFYLSVISVYFLIDETEAS